MRRYTYVGPEDVRRRVAGSPQGAPVHGAAALEPFVDGEPLTYVVGLDGVLRVAARRSEHVACAGGGEVLGAGELTVVRDAVGVRVSEVSNQSTGYCPEPASWAAVVSALESAGIAHPARFTYEAIFRRCPACRERNLVKDDWFVCALCGEDLPTTWNFDP